MQWKIDDNRDKRMRMKKKRITKDKYRRIIAIN